MPGSRADSEPPAWVGFAEPSVTEADIAAVTHVLRSGWLTTGAENELLEQELAAYLTGDDQAGQQPLHVVAMSSSGRCTSSRGWPDTR